MLLVWLCATAVLLQLAEGQECANKFDTQFGKGFCEQRKEHCGEDGPTAQHFKDMCALTCVLCVPGTEGYSVPTGYCLKMRSECKAQEEITAACVPGPRRRCVPAQFEI